MGRPPKSQESEMQDIETGASLTEQPTKHEKKKEEKVLESNYPIYEKWKVNVTPLGNKKYRLVCFEPLRQNIKIEHNVAEDLNEQSHNSNVRLFPKGEARYGHEVIITAN